MTIPTYFITGTDTDVGKTFVTSCLAKGFLEQGKRVTIYKPVQTGVHVIDEGDAMACARALGDPDRLQVDTTYCFVPPCAPSVADTHRVIDVSCIQERVKALQTTTDVLLIEGAGGVYCPVTPTHTMVDIMATILHVRPIVVSRYTLGTINHTLLSLNALRQRQLEPYALVVSEFPRLRPDERESLAVRTVVDQLRWYGQVSRIYEVPFQPNSQPLALLLE
jgi:dethiobiotin synthetase